MYDNPEDYVDEEKRQRKWCLEKALNLAEKRKTKEEKTDMDAEDVVEAAENFKEFLNF